MQINKNLTMNAKNRMLLIGLRHLLKLMSQILQESYLVAFLPDFGLLENN